MTEKTLKPTIEDVICNVLSGDAQKMPWILLPFCVRTSCRLDGFL